MSGHVAGNATRHVACVALVDLLSALRAVRRDAAGREDLLEPATAPPFAPTHRLNARPSRRHRSCHSEDLMARPRVTRPPGRRVGPTDPEWYKDAIIYELHVRSFQDSNDDGIGDLPGLTSRLGYLHDLGVTALWLLPFYPSPLRDDGYDIADYTGVHPAYGTIDDFRRFLDEAHRRGLRVITELVINHTSDQHLWFRRARAAPADHPDRAFYVWSQSPERYEGARIIFQDSETSNWTWDPVAEAYYWHRFYSHQPDLNFDNPAVFDAFRDVLDF